ncbi:trehalase-domain-containing protein [Spinellus fusiger]|nr:trehalase-domain-containing protein [Spinellus fusiger]
MSNFPFTDHVLEHDAHAPASTYYTTGANAGRRTRAYSRVQTTMGSESYFETQRTRRASHDDKNKKHRFLIDVEETQRKILQQEDTDGDFQITINDLGPKTLALGTADSGGYKKYDIRGTYMLSNLLQELALARDYGRKHIVLDEARLNENPVDRLSRMIRYGFWEGLTRRLDADTIESVCADPKDRSKNPILRVYIPHDETEQYAYYTKVAQQRPLIHLRVIYLPEKITAEYVKSINEHPGMLALAMKRRITSDGGVEMKGEPFVVPGGRFNEMYGWDSYFAALGLLVDKRLDLVQSMVENFAYQIKHYGKILNANRSYYLARSQPPFLTDMALKVYEELPPHTPHENKEWLRRILKSAIKEYHSVWMSEPRLDKKTMLSRYHPDGLGIPPETEASHFDHIIEPFAKKYNVSIEEFDAMYNAGKVKEPELDEYFMHDRAVRESGHDTTYRFEKVCGHLATIDLNSLLYKYETDIADAIRDHLDDHLEDFEGRLQTATEWLERAKQRKSRIDKYLWNDKENLYFDYDTVKEKQTTYESVTAFWAMWAGCASMEQANQLVHYSLAKFEVIGGLISGTEASRGQISLQRPNRQWDFPFGWAPHQMMAWVGFDRYGMRDIARRLAYRWLFTITKSFVDFNGVVPEKFDVVSLSHKVHVEYGNVGTDFKYVPREGFGWMNASYQVGLSYLNTQMRRALGTCTNPDLLLERQSQLQGHSLSKEEVDRALHYRRQSEMAAHRLKREGSLDGTTHITEPVPEESGSHPFA